MHMHTALYNRQVHLSHFLVTCLNMERTWHVVFTPDHKRGASDHRGSTPDHAELHKDLIIEKAHMIMQHSTRA